MIIQSNAPTNAGSPKAGDTRNVSRWVLSVSREGDSTTSTDSCSVLCHHQCKEFLPQVVVLHCLLSLHCSCFYIALRKLFALYPPELVKLVQHSLSPSPLAVSHWPQVCSSPFPSFKVPAIFSLFLISPCGCYNKLWITFPQVGRASFGLTFVYEDFPSTSGPELARGTREKRELLHKIW